MSRTILAVDDSSTMLEAISIALEEIGCKVITAQDGADALFKLKTLDKVHAIVTDVNMPNMDGITLTTEIRKLPRFGCTPIIILTTESDKDKKEAGKNAGATGWIVKPFSPEQLASVIRKVCP